MEETAIRARLYYLAELGTLDLWIDEPSKEYVAEPLGDNIVLKLDREGNVIGLEVIDLRKLKREDLDRIPKNLRDPLIRVLKDIATKTRELTHKE